MLTNDVMAPHQFPASIYKICRATDWAQAVAFGQYTGSPDDLRDGFIHLSTAAQVHDTAAKYFRGQEGLVLVKVDAVPLGDALKWELSRGGAMFPHVYGPLPTRLAVTVEPLALAADGVPIIPELDAC